ncbi:MAG: hypothetical protein M1831_003951 [Alyxoria varia]|nr:MAG: hypothetical protein M1831_003951 [Alyxoria varia]
MRSTFRLFATVKKSSSVLSANAPTGLTGLNTHPCPRPHLIWLYNSTLAKLSAFPETSVYRQSTEALTRHRLRTVASVEPAGYPEYRDRMSNLLDQSSGHTKQLIQQILDGKGYEPVLGQDPDEREQQWDGERVEARTEGPATAQDLETMPKLDEAESKREEEEERQPEMEHEPQLTAQQVSDLEHQLSAGLIEEVVEVAKGELELVDSMREARIWEELAEKPPEGQWQYFERDTHVGRTQSP